MMIFFHFSKIWYNYNWRNIAFYTVRGTVLLMTFVMCVAQDDAHIFCRESQV